MALHKIVGVSRGHPKEGPATRKSSVMGVSFLRVPFLVALKGNQKTKHNFGGLGWHIRQRPSHMQLEAPLDSAGNVRRAISCPVESHRS